MADREVFKRKTSFLEINVLVVDDESLILSLVSSNLRAWNYNVTTLKDPNYAMEAIENKQGKPFDIVLSDLHMPGLHGLELQKRIHRRFKIPVIFMSANDKESTILQCLEAGARLYMVKPVLLHDVKNIWQHVFRARKGKSIVIDPIPRFPRSSPVELVAFDDMNCVSSKKEDKDKELSKKKTSKRCREGDEQQDHCVKLKKAKVVWTNSLHTRFLIAIRRIGFEKAVPKKILEFMNVPGLSRENVASHLQKYRLFLKRVAEMGVGISKIFIERALKSTFSIGLPSHLLKYFPQDQSSFTENQQGRTLFHLGCGGSTSNATSRNCRKKKVAKRDLATQHGNRKISRNKASYQQLNYWASQGASRVESNKFDLDMTLSGGTSYGLMYNASSNLFNGANAVKMYAQQTQAVPENYKQMPESSNNYIPTLISNCAGSIYGGLQMKTHGDVNEMNQMQFSDGYGPINGGMTVAPLGSNSYFSQGESSSAGYHSANQFQPVFNNATQNPLLMQKYAFENEVVYIDNMSRSNNISYYINDNFLDQINNYQSHDQEEGGKHVTSTFLNNSSHPVEINAITSDQNQDREIVADNSAGAPNHGFGGLSYFDLSRNQEDGDGGLDLELLNNNNKDNPEEGYIYADQMWDDEFLNSLLED